MINCTYNILNFIKIIEIQLTQIKTVKVFYHLQIQKHQKLVIFQWTV